MNVPALSRTAPPPTQKLPAVQFTVPWLSTTWLVWSRTALVTLTVAPGAIVVVPAPLRTVPDHSAVPLITRSPLTVPPLSRNRPAPCSLAGDAKVNVPPLIWTVAPAATSMVPVAATELPPVNARVAELPCTRPSLSKEMPMVARLPVGPVRVTVPPLALWKVGGVPPTQLEMLCPSAATVNWAAFSIWAPPPTQKLPAVQLSVP